MSSSFSLNQIVEKLGGELANAADTKVHRVGSLGLASEGAISFFSDSKYNVQLQETRASAVILKAEHVNLTKLPVIVTDNPYAYFAKVSQLLNPLQPLEKGIHESAVVATTATIPKSCSIAAQVVIGENVILGEGVSIGAGSVIERDSVMGDHTMLEANVTIKHGSQIGEHCHLYSGAIIGNDGFGYAEETTKDNSQYWVKIPQIGRAILKGNVDIGANTTVDRGTIDDTIIEEGVKIDNLVQIAHNCRIGAHTVIAGCVGIAGSAIIGSHCRIGGAAMILGHLEIVAQVTISPGSMIMRTILKQGTYTALMPFQKHTEWLKTAANIRHLSQLSDKIKMLEAAIENLENIKKS